MAEPKENEFKPLPRDFSEVVLTLDNVLLSDEQIKVSPSMKDGMSREDENELRFYGCHLIQNAGQLLQLPQTAQATGQAVFQRFYYSKSFVKHNYEVTAMACMNLAAKIEENPRRLRDVLNVFHHFKQVQSQKEIKSLVLDQNYINMKTQVIKAERRLLKELGFCVHVKHPHKIICGYLQMLGLMDNKPVFQYAWNCMNDSLRTDLIVRFTPEAIAVACIFLATRRMKIPLSTVPPWYDLLNVSLSSIETICKAILLMYQRPKPNIERLDKVCEELRAQQQKEKMKMKVSQEHTPNSVNRTESPREEASPSPAMVKKIKPEEESHTLNGSSGEKNGHKNKRRHDDSEGSNIRSSDTRSHSSRSRSRSPPPKRKRHSYSPRRFKNRGDYHDDYHYHKEKRSHKHKKHTRSRSRSLSPIARYSSSKSNKKYSKEKQHSYSPQEKSHRSRKHRNGQRDSPRYEKYDKYRR